MGRNHLRVLGGMSGVQVVAVCDPSSEAAAGAGVPVVPDVAGAIATGIDLAIVASPTATHEAVALELADADVHALIEKPLADDGAAAERIRDAFAARGLVGAVGHIERFNPAALALRRRLGDGQLGEVFQIATRRQSPFPARIADVGVILDLASHDVDLTSWVAGQRYREVSARVAHRSGRRHEDLVAAVGVLDGGLVVNHLVNWLTPYKERVTVVTGERGCLVADTLHADLTFHHNGEPTTRWPAMEVFRGVSEGDVVRYAIAKVEPLVTELAAFAAQVRGEHPEFPTVTMEEGAEVVRVAEALTRAGRSGSLERV